MAVRLSTGLRNYLLSTGSLRDALEGGAIRVYSGFQPATADDAETGELLGYINANGLPWADGGLSFQEAASGAMAKHPDDPWFCEGLAAGTPGWARFYASDRTEGASSTAVRLDMACGSGGELQLADLDAGSEDMVDYFILMFPT